MAAAAGQYWILPSSLSGNIIKRRNSSKSKVVLNYLCLNQQPQYTKFLPPRASADSKRTDQQIPLVPKKKSKPRLITISSSEGKWQEKWTTDYTFTMQELQLHDLLEDVHKNTQVSIRLSVQKHAGFGLSVEGIIKTCFTIKCCNCCSPYLREIDTTFKVWVLPSTRQVRDTSHQLPLIGCDDPSVIYVKPGYEADLDSLLQDTIRLATSVKETCSEACEKSEPKLHYIGAKNAASVESRWSKLLELKQMHKFTET